MSSNHVKLGLLGSTLCLFVLFGCSKRPDPEIEAARQALNQSTTIEVRTYAPEALRKVQEAQVALDEALKKQEEKFALFRSYDEVRTLAEAASKAADDAVKQADQAKVRARNESGEMLASAESLLHETRKLLTTAPVGKGTTVDLQMMKADLDEAESMLIEARKLFEREEYLSAKARTEAAHATIEGVKSAVQQAQQIKQAAALQAPRRG